MGQVIPRPAIRRAGNRRVMAALAALHERTSYNVIDLATLESHGLYPSLGEALGCVEFDGLAEFQIWRGDALVRCVEAA